MAVEGIIANGVTEILKKLSSVVTNEITLVWDFKDELKNLQSTLNMVLAVMEDAEKKQLSSNAVRLWMEELKAIAYDAEDILDDYSYEVIIHRKREKEEEYKSTAFNKVCNVFSCSNPSFVVSWKLAHKVKKINEKFNEIANRKHDLGLQITDVGSSSSSHELMMMNRETYSFSHEDWKIVGRENDKSTIIKMLLKEEEENSTNQDGGKFFSVIPIVGMGGLGKTKMAQQVYNDEAVQKHFDLKIWICVSDPFDIKKLWKNIGKSIRKQSKEGKEGKEYDDATTMDAVAQLLQDDVKGKKFMLVLDDVWNEKLADWNNFKRPFMVGREGSKILVTTRNEKVALIMVDKFEPYHLGILKENDCWSLFKEIAFGCGVAGAVETPKLVEIGKEMVKRCGGLPLAVIFLGSLMRSKKKEEEWMIIGDTEVWHESREGKNSEILPSLRLSYDYLPSHLKLCFSYCCIFPKDYIIKRQTLIQLWMAEGFLIESPGENAMSMEEIGNEYFDSLLSGFFFQDVEKDEDGVVWKCKMHDLVHDLARSVVGKNECLIVENADDIDCISEETRRLNLVKLDEGILLPKVLKAVKKAKNLRTILVECVSIGFDIGNAFKENKKLRVLGFRYADSTVPSSSSSSIGRLKHLRYLDLRGDCIPKRIGRLSFLQTLREFDVGDKKKKKKKKKKKLWNATGDIKELEGLNLLSGELSINSLENVRSEIDARRANLKEKKNLRGLNLSWSQGENATKKNAEAVLEGLRPHPNLRTLFIGGFEGVKLPRWIEDSSCLPNLVVLELVNCTCIEQVAGFGALPSLRDLTLWSMKKVECIGNEFYYSAAAAAATVGRSSSTTIAFPSLKRLSLEDMSSLEEWVVPVSPLSTTGTTCCFPLLEEIEIKFCPHFRTITPTTTINFPSLKVLNLRDIDGSAAKTLVINNFNSLTSLRLHSIPNLISLPRQGLIENNNTLLSLEIWNCSQFKGFLLPNKDEDEGEEDQEEVGVVGQVSSTTSCSSSSSSSLQSLSLYACPAVRYYPNFRSLTSLRTLKIQECKESESLLTCLSSSSSSLENLEHVQILKTKTRKKEVVFEWRKSWGSFKE